MAFFSPVSQYRSPPSISPRSRRWPVALLCLGLWAALPAHADPAERAITGLIQGLGNLLQQEKSAPVKGASEAPFPVVVAAVTPATSTVPTIAPAVGSTEWSTFFKSMEINCNKSEDMKVLFAGMRKRQVTLPDPYLSQAGKLKIVNRDGYKEAILPVAGTYYGVPVKEVVYYYGENNGTNGFYIILSGSVAQVRKALAKVQYRKAPAAPGSENEPSPQGEIGADQRGRAGVFCDTST